MFLDIRNNQHRNIIKKQDITHYNKNYKVCRNLLTLEETSMVNT